jgi:hypothetical protein
MHPNYRTIKAFPLTIEASIEADWLWKESAGECRRVIDEWKENRT